MGRSSGLLLLLLQLLLFALQGHEGAFVGVNIGTAVEGMPSATQVVALLKKQQITHVRLFDADRQMLTALANTTIQVVVGVPNDQLIGVGESSSAAATWVKMNVDAYLPATNITGIVVGSEVLTTLPNAALLLVPAMKSLHAALVAADLDSQVKVSTSLSTDIILDSFPPSNAFFNASWNRVLPPLLSFLQDTGSHLMLNIYPYYVFVQAQGVFPLDYALFRPLLSVKEAVDPETLLHYTNVFDAMVDAAYFAMADLNISDVPVVVSETGWPSAGDANEADATVDNAITYNSNVITHVLNNSGTPKHPGVAVDTYIYELFNEDLRPGPTSERNWGLFAANCTPLYVLHLTGGSILANDTTSQEFCVASSSANSSMLQNALDWACGPGAADCQAIQDGEPCFLPNTLSSHASYAFNSYFQKMGMAYGSCNFNGAAMITSNNPSYNSCVFVSTNGTFSNGTGASNGTFPLISSNGTNSTSSSSAHLLRPQLHPIVYRVVALPFLLWNLAIL